MNLETMFLAALQSSFLLGLLHGVSPCGHSWLVLTPFVSKERSGYRVILLTGMFLGGTTAACLLIGASLGAIASFVPPATGWWVEILTSVCLILIGLLLLYNPHILHNHPHDHAHENCHCEHEHSDSHGMLSRLKHLSHKTKLVPLALFAIGFLNMIVPCPTAAVMYTYTLNSGSIFTAIIVFGTYALSTAISVSVVIFLIFKTVSAVSKLKNERVEPFIMRFAGLVLIFFSTYGIYHGG